MRTHRFYSNIELKLGSTFQLPKEAAHHCIQVLRYKIGAELILFNGDGFDYIAKINSIETKCCYVEIINKLSPETESPLRIHLYQGIARGDKMDLIIQKSIELGVNQITPVFTERCNVKLDAKRLNKKQSHWQSVAISACEQSGRSLIPVINSAVKIKEVKRNTKAKAFYLEPTATSHFHDFDSFDQVSLFIGPEGGLSDNDLQHLDNIGVLGVKLGPRILRTETAGLACIAILQSHFGDI